MSEVAENCLKCERKIMQSISNRCMYCGADLPEEHHLSQEEKNQVLSAKLAQFKEHEENADTIISTLCQDFGIPEKKKSRQKRKQENAAVAAAIAATTNMTSGSGGDGSCS